METKKTQKEDVIRIINNAPVDRESFECVNVLVKLNV